IRPRSPATEPTPTTLPAPRSSMRGAMVCRKRAGPVKLSITVPSTSAGSASISACGGMEPTKTATLTVPSSARARSRIGSKLSGSRASNRIASATGAPRSRASTALASRSSMSRPARMTPSPFPTTARTKARAIDEVAPRMIQVSAMSEAPQVQTPGHVGFEMPPGVCLRDRLRPGRAFGIHLCHCFGVCQRVLREVDPSACTGCVADKLANDVGRPPAIGKVHGEGIALHREGHHARAPRTHALQHRKRRSEARPRDLLEHRAQGVSGLQRDNALKLVEACLAVEPVPVLDLVERKEEVVDRPDEGAPPRRYAPPVERVEHLHHGRRQRESRRVERHRLRAFLPGREARARLALFENAAPEAGAARGRVYPAHRIGRGRGVEEGEMLVPVR